MSDHIDPEDLYKAAWRETQGQPVAAVGRAWDGYAHAIATNSELAGTEWAPVDAVGRPDLIDFGPGSDWDAAAHIRLLRQQGGASSGYTADLIQNLHCAVETLRTRLASAEKALAFYADISKYHAPYTGGMGALYFDCGEVARAALSEGGRDDG